jgi:hypothetical protein
MAVECRLQRFLRMLGEWKAVTPRRAGQVKVRDFGASELVQAISAQGIDHGHPDRGQSLHGCAIDVRRRPNHAARLRRRHSGLCGSNCWRQCGQHGDHERSQFHQVSRLAAESGVKRSRREISEPES